MVETIHQLPWFVVVLACLTLGLAPFRPPHIVEKLQMLREGTLKRPLDWFDLLYHSLPFFVLFAKVAVEIWLALG
jgi:hypothetical protein